MIAINGFEFGLVDLIVWAIVGLICGGIGQAIVGYSPGGLLASIAIGLIGALLGSWLARQLGLPSVLTFTYDGRTIELLWTILGAAILVLILSLIRRPVYYRRRRV